MILNSLSVSYSTMNHNQKQTSGFTLIELILYVAIITIFIGGAVQFAWDILYGQVKSSVQQEVNQNIRLASQRISYEIRHASSINSVSGSTLSLEMTGVGVSRNPTVFDLSSGQLRIGYGSSGPCPTSSPCPLTSNLVDVSSLTFTNLSSGASKNIMFDITVDYANNTRQEFSESSTYSSSVELRVD